MVQEEWKEVEGTNGAYKISSLGRVYSERHQRIMKNTNTKLGYPVVVINCGSKKQFFVHRLVAIAFIPNPNNYPVVNHIDGNRANHSIDNLEWCTQSHNVKHEYDTGRRIGKTNMKGLFGKDNPNSIPIVKKSTSGAVLEIIYGVSEAARSVGGSASHIVKVCRGKLKHHKGFRWEYM